MTAISGEFHPYIDYVTIFQHIAVFCSDIIREFVLNQNNQSIQQTLKHVVLNTDIEAKLTEKCMDG